MNLKPLFNFIALILAFVGVITISMFVHEYSHYNDVKDSGEVKSFMVYCFGDCDGVAGSVEWYKRSFPNGTEEVVSSELKAYVIQIIIAVLLLFILYKSEFAIPNVNKQS